MGDVSKPEVVGVDELEQAGPEFPSSPEKTVAMARQANASEHAMTLRMALGRYPRAVLWSALLSTCIVMEGYDIVLVSSLMAQPAFARRFGTVPDTATPDSPPQVSAAWQAGLTNAVSVGTVIGAFANGYCTHRFGYRRVLLVALGLIAAFVFVTFFATGLPMLLVGQFLCGIPWGVFATMAPAYASEICPLALRGHVSNFSVAFLAPFGTITPMMYPSLFFFYVFLVSKDSGFCSLHGPML